MPLLSRRNVLLAVVPALAGCVAKPIILDRQAAANIKRIGLPTIGMPTSPTVTVINAVSNQLGVIGLIAGATVRSNRRDALSRILASRGFDARSLLSAALTTQLTARGMTLVPFPVDPNRSDFLASVPASPAYDAVLDLYVSEYGFVALSDADADPYRATIQTPVRLVATPGRDILMKDSITISSSDTTATAPKKLTFSSFSDIENDPAAGVAALSAAFEDLATGIVRRIT